MADGVGLPETESRYVAGPMLTFDPQAERHIGEHAEAANALLKGDDREGFEIPELAKA